MQTCVEKDTSSQMSNQVTFVELQDSVSRLFYDSIDRKRLPSAARLHVLVVDDEPFVADAVRMMLAFDGVDVAAVGSGREAIQVFKDGEFDVVITDYAMPRMKGDELALHLKEISPSCPVVLISAYAEMLKSNETPLIGIDFIISKPFLLENLREAIEVTSPDRDGKSVNSWYPILQAEGTILVLNDAVWSFRKLVQLTRESTGVPALMIRHKAKNLVADYIHSLPTFTDRKLATSKLSLQLMALRRFYDRIALSNGQNLATYLDQVVRDLRREHSGIDVCADFGKDLGRIKFSADSVALIALVVCELIDNAVEALKGNGRVLVEMDLLPSKHSLYIKVSDNGPGIDSAGAGRIFKEQYSTRGTERGLGLHLVKEGILKLGGTINYTYAAGAIFKALIPLPKGKSFIRKLVKSVKKVKPLRKLLRNNADQRTLRLAFSYSHKDEVLRDELESHLKQLQRQGLIETWHDRKIAPGDKWADVIDENFTKADVILPLVSADFLASDYCNEIEMRIALERDKAGEACVVPIIVRACDWHGAPFGKLQGLPKDAKPVTSWTNRDEAWSDVARGLRRVVEELRTHQRRASA